MCFVRYSSWTAVDRVHPQPRVHQTFSKVKTALPKNDKFTFLKYQNVCKTQLILAHFGILER